MRIQFGWLPGFLVGGVYLRPSWIGEPHAIGISLGVVTLTILWGGME